MSEYDKSKQRSSDHSPEQERQREVQKRPKPSDSESPAVKDGDRGPHVDRVGMPTSDDGFDDDDREIDRGTD